MSELTKALIQFHYDVDKIDKNASANYGLYADLSGVLSTVTPALLKNNLVLTQEFLEDSIVTTLRHVSGETINSTCKLVVNPARNELHSWGCSVTYTRRYQICSILGIVADMDMDGELEAPASAKTASAPVKPANVQKAVMSQAFQAGQKAIKAAKTLDSLSDLSKRVAERFDKQDITKQEYDDLLKLLLNKESELTEFNS